MTRPRRPISRLAFIHSRRCRAALLLLGAALALAGCGQPERAPEAVLDAATLQLTDFPPNEHWRLDTTPNAPEDAQFDQEFSECLDRSGVVSPNRVSAQRDSESFVQGSSLVSGHSWVIPDAAARNAVLDRADPLVSCIMTVIDHVLLANTQPSDKIVRSAPERIKVVTSAERTEARAAQLGDADRSFFIDMVLVEQKPTVILTLFLHAGDISPDDESQIVGAPVKRVAEQ